MLTKRIIPCLDIKDGRTVKGVQFEALKDAGNPIELATYYSQQGADELVFLDINATNENRKTWLHIVQNIAQNIQIPFTVGGGIKTLQDAANLIKNGADKISTNTAAFTNPNLIQQIAAKFGIQCNVVAIDTKKESDGNWYVYLNGGRQKTNTLCIDWAIQAQQLGAGEILLTAMNNDGTKQGFALDITAQLSNTLKIPIIASGGGGTMQHFADVFNLANADAALAASVFHYKEVLIPNLKQYLLEKQILVRPV